MGVSMGEPLKMAGFGLETPIKMVDNLGDPHKKTPSLGLFPLELPFGGYTGIPHYQIYQTNSYSWGQQTWMSLLYLFFLMGLI
jgi:hypothetical protein